MLRDHDYSIAELEAELSLCHSTVWRAMKQLKEKGLVHIVEWTHHDGKKGNGRHAAVYRLGKRKDAPKPENQPNSVYSKRYRDKNRILIRARYAAKKGKIPNMFAQLIAR